MGAGTSLESGRVLWKDPVEIQRNGWIERLKSRLEELHNWLGLAGEGKKRSKDKIPVLACVTDE